MQENYCAEAGVSLGAVFCVACFGVASCLGAAACWPGDDALAIWLSDVLDSSSASAEAGSISPQPNWSSRPLGLSLRAVEVSTSRMVAASTFGWRSIRRAATPLTCAAATDVPVVS